MATGRTVDKYTRVYINSVDYSGFARDIGPLDCQFEEGNAAAMNEAMLGAWLGQVTVSPGTLNALFQDANTVLHPLGTIYRDNLQHVMVALGIQAVPAIGDPVFAGEFNMDDYLVSKSLPVGVAMKFSPTRGTSVQMTYPNPWGVLLHANAAATAVNSTDGILDNVIATPASTTDGGYMAYQVISAAGSGLIQCTIKVCDGATANACTNDIVTSGVLNLGDGAGTFSNAAHAVVAMAPTASVNKYLRWQIVLGTAGDACTSVTFVLSFSRRKL